MRTGFSFVLFFGVSDVVSECEWFCRHCKLTSRTEDTSLAVAKGLQWFYAQPISSYFSTSEHFTRFVLKSLQILSGFTTVVVEDMFSDMLREIWCSFYPSVSNLSLTPNMERQDGRSATNYTFFLSFFALLLFFFLTSVTKTSFVPPNATLVCSPIIKHQHWAPLVNQYWR